MYFIWKTPNTLNSIPDFKNVMKAKYPMPILMMKNNNISRSVSPKEQLEILIIDRLKERLKMVQPGHLYKIPDFISDCIPLTKENVPARNAMFDVMMNLARAKKIVLDEWDNIVSVNYYG